ncbi:MAG: abortive phage infection protein [Thermoclostridium sp.]|jgi:predicted transcriptional regulator of viral defense system|nr:abortive phage infection protein [Thermoclostridium sp.]
MSVHEIAEKTIRECGGVARNSDFQRGGLRNYQITKLCSLGFLERVKRGYYQLSSYQDSEEEKVIAKAFPDSILCMDSALFYYGYSDRTPLEWTLAFPRSVSRNRLRTKTPKIKPYFIKEDLFLLGKTEQEINGVHLSIYDRDRTICDCFKYQRKIDSEMFNKAIVAYSKDVKKNLGNLITYAKKMRVYRKMSEIMGVLING